MLPESLPGLRLLRGYRPEWLRGDVVPGVVLAGLVFWIFCSSRHTAVTVASAISARGHAMELAGSGDYRETGGVTCSIETGVRGRPRRLRIVVETVKVNPALDDSRFRVPR